MKPLQIADYLGHLGSAPIELASPRREASPFRPRSLPSLRDDGPRPPALNGEAKAKAADNPKEEMRLPRTPWDRKAVPLDPSAQQLQTAMEPARGGDIAERLAAAHARGREEGLAEGRAEAAERCAAELAAAEQKSMTERLDFQVNEYANLEAAIRSGLVKVEQDIGASVARILAPFIANRVVKQATDELCDNIARLCAGGSPGLIRIRGPESKLALLRGKIANLPAEVEFIDADGVEVVVAAGATRIATELRPWADLLASLDA